MCSLRISTDKVEKTEEHVRNTGILHVLSVTLIEVSVALIDIVNVVIG